MIDARLWQLRWGRCFFKGDSVCVLKISKTVKVNWLATEAGSERWPLLHDVTELFNWHQRCQS
jgi:hypothetical protein